MLVEIDDELFVIALVMARNGCFGKARKLEITGLDDETDEWVAKANMYDQMAWDLLDGIQKGAPTTCSRDFIQYARNELMK